jgi:hypothetical protein
LTVSSAGGPAECGSSPVLRNFVAIEKHAKIRAGELLTEKETVGRSGQIA